jgi:hypothetical protein
VDLNHQMELMNVSMTTAICAQIGCTWSKREQDFGIDLQIHGETFETDPQIDFQLKATTKFSIINEKNSVIKYALDVKNYRDLIKTNVRKPRLLCLAILPKDPKIWIKHHPYQIELKYGIYWVDLKGQPSTSNSETITISIPLSNKLDSIALTNLMEVVNEKGAIS